MSFVVFLMVFPTKPMKLGSHKDLNIPIVKQTTDYRYKNVHIHLQNHPNSLMSELSSLTLHNNLPRRLKML